MDENKVTVFSDIIYDIIGFIKTAVELVKQLLAGIEIKYGWQKDEEATDSANPEVE
ncbi:MAG: hypothetical protein J1E34_00425 [Oscillospiraceae bacterium]|nr:hypothetical protein [Oscillospiraceae bacterium]